MAAQVGDVDVVHTVAAIGTGVVVVEIPYLRTGVVVAAATAAAGTYFERLQTSSLRHLRHRIVVPPSDHRDRLYVETLATKTTTKKENKNDSTELNESRRCLWRVAVAEVIQKKRLNFQFSEKPVKEQDFYELVSS